MKPNIPPHFRCIACTKIYRWRPERAGRKVLCVCGLIMRCATTPDGKPTSLGHKAPLIKPSEARVHASVGENAVFNPDVPQWVEESTTLAMSPSDLANEISSADLDLNLDLAALVDSPPAAASTPVINRPEAPAPAISRPEAPTPVINRPEAPTRRPGSAAGVRPGSSAGLRPGSNAGTQSPPPAPTDPTTCPSCRSKVRAGAVLCVQCGTTLKPPTDAPTTPTSTGFFSKVLSAVVKPKEPTIPPLNKPDGPAK
jgi:hypothetical protein